MSENARRGFVPRGPDDTAEDHQAIQELLQLYAYALDSRDLDLLDEIFRLDAVIEIKLFGNHTLESWREGSREGLKSVDATMHFCSPAVIRVDGDRASSRCYFMAQHAVNALRPEPLLMIGGYYDDEFVRVDGRWWLQHRIGTSSWWQGNPAVVGSDVAPGGVDWMETRNVPPWLRPS